LQKIDPATLDEKLFEQLAEQVKTAPAPVILSMALVSYMASQYVSAWIWGTWLLSEVALQGLRWYVYRKLPIWTHIPVKTRMQTAIAINIANTLLHCLSLFLFPLFSPYYRAVQSIIFVGMGVASTMTAAGFLPFTLAHIVLDLLPLFCLWLWSGLNEDGGVIDLGVGVIGFGYSATLYLIAGRIFLLYKESFDARWQLAAALAKAVAAGRAKTRFLAAASHDLRPFIPWPYSARPCPCVNLTTAPIILSKT
jgi:hypothetical protein